MLYILFGLTFFFLLLNFIITEGDYLHPSTLFCEMFFVYELICIIGQSAYAITIHSETVLVFMCGFCAFTSLGFLAKGTRQYDSKSSAKVYATPQYISIPKIYIYMLILLQIVTNLFFIKYLRALATAYGSGGSLLGEMINLYDTMTKFWRTIFNSLNVAVPMVYRIGNPITTAAAYLVVYVAVNNYMACKKINKLHLLVIILLCFNILLNGSRSPLLRIVTMCIILSYIFNYRKHGRRKGSLQTFFKLVGIVLFTSIIMIGLLYIMGRGHKMGSILGYIFTYTGAPIVNLDNYLNTGHVNFWGNSSELFGSHTFKALHSYIGKLFHINSFLTIKSINPFAFSSNGIEIGNVYTTFYTFIYDFGFSGVFPLISIVAYYYIFNYKKVLKKPSSKVIDFRLFIYAYLFNDLIMLTFSNRFFETVCDAPFIKLFIIAWLLEGVILEHSLKIGCYRFKVPTIKG